jgi:hypothetical protein
MKDVVGLLISFEEIDELNLNVNCLVEGSVIFE